MDSISLHQLIIFSLVTIIVAVMVLGLFRLRLYFGLTPLYVTLGVFQPLQVFLASSIYAEILPGVIVSPGSVIMFTASLFAILLVYIREDALEARKVIYGILLANIAMTLLLLTFGWQLRLPNTQNFLNLSADLFNQNVRVTIAGTMALFADVLLIIFIYEAIWRWVTKNQFLCIYLTMALILVFDSLIFSTGAFLGQSNYTSILISGTVGKLMMALPFSLIMTLYLHYDEDAGHEPSSFVDIFDTLSYRQKFEQAQLRGEQAAAGLVISENRFKQLFDDSPVPLWEEDFTELTAFLEEIKQKGVTDFSAYFHDNPIELQVCARKIKIKDINRATLELHKASDKTELLGNLDKIFTETSYVAFRDEIVAIAEGKKSFETEGQVKTLDGELRDVSLRMQILEGSQTALLATTDITERKQAELEREKLRTQLNQAQKMESIGRLAGGVAHDFNNMLSVILGYTGMAMRKSASNDLILRDLQEVYNAARRSADITQQLLAFARKQAISPKVIDLNEAVTGMLKMLRRLIAEDITLSWQPGPGLTPVLIDPSQLDQILANLCVNAQDAISGVGNLTIETDCIHLDENYCADRPGFTPGDYVMLAVSDDGCGIDKEFLEHLFEPFFTTKGTGKGTGLGLATVYGIVKQNDGYINVDSELGKGTTFRIYLPRQQGETETVEMQELTGIPIARGETVLIVEDEGSILELTKRLLEELGYTILIADKPGAAIALAENYHGEIHLLITDVVMPEMNGRDLATKLHGLYPDLKVLYMSGYTANVIAHHGVLEDGVKFIQKPFTSQALAVKVRAALE